MARKALPGNRLEIATCLPTPLRIGLGGLGAFIAIMCLRDIWRGLAPLSLLTPLLLLPGIGLAVGSVLIAAMIWGPDERWIIAPGRLTVIRTLRRFRSEKTHAAADIHSAAVETVTWDSRPDTFKLDIKLASGRVLRSPDFATHGAAESARLLLLGL